MLTYSCHQNEKRKTSTFFTQIIGKHVVDKQKSQQIFTIKSYMECALQKVATNAYTTESDNKCS